ncbi:hypothetical protein Bca52824_086799 [Brassica carinata]|uniref:CTLH domain-containing protein n=1 Tax=Brassica carinata TaxID=52824 RepID=A0A8X7TN07_BRACI|nr:hypothetical protein Bca52824_086799 [Brassica carinata]
MDSNNAFRVTNNQTKKPSSLIVETGSVHEQFANISLSSEDTSSLFYRQNPKTPSQLSLRDCRIIRGASKFCRQSRRKKQSRSLKISVVLFLQILPLIQDDVDDMATSKKVITREEWEKKLNAVKLRKEDMNTLVMNFLVTEGYVDAADKFQRESGTKHILSFIYFTFYSLWCIGSEIDLATITDRMAVKKAVQNGNVEDAIEKVNDLNPENRSLIRLRTCACGYSTQIPSCSFIFSSKGKTEEALEFAQEELAPRGEENQAFLQELEKTVALLVFEDASNCPVKDLLDISQRLKTTSEVNAAILTSQSHEKDPKLPSLLKMLIWAQNQLDEKPVYPHINDLSTGQLEDPPE